MKVPRSEEACEELFYSWQAYLNSQGYKVTLGEDVLEDTPWRGMNSEAAKENGLKGIASNAIPIQFRPMDKNPWRRALQDLFHEIKERNSMRDKGWGYRAAHKHASKAQYDEPTEAEIIQGGIQVKQSKIVSSALKREKAFAKGVQKRKGKRNSFLTI